jgi:DNA-binding CsgD family transcriptional regulator
MSEDRLVFDVGHAASEALSIRELGDSVLPILDRTLRTSGSVLYVCRVKDRIENLSGPWGSDREYGEQHYPHDRMQVVMRSLNPRLFHGSRHPEWRKFQGTGPHRYLAKMDVANYLHVRLTEAPHMTAGGVGILLGRSPQQPDFGEEDELRIASVLPSLRAVVRRIMRAEERARAAPIVDAILDMAPPKLALDREGSLLWASPRAEQLLSLPPAPEELVRAARERRSRCELPSGLRADLQPARTDAGVEFVAVEINVTYVGDGSLTGSEREVLALLARGLTDRQIGRRRSVSEATIHTHVARILSKLGVRSRLQAALLARGIVPDVEDE